MSTLRGDQARTRSVPMVRGWVSDHRLTSYVVLAYVLSWAYWVPLVLGSRSVDTGVGWPSQMPGLAGPAISALVVTAVIGGRAGLAGLWQRLTRWRVGWWWLSVPAVLTAGALGLALVRGATDTGALTGYNGISAGVGPVATIVLVLVLNGFGEETGWRGFLADDLLRRHSLTVTALLVALVWAPWHAPLFFFQSTFSDFSLAAVVGWAIGLTAGSVVLTWLYRGASRSILLVAVWHTAFNFTSATPAAAGTVAAITSTLVMLAAVVIIVADQRKPEPAALSSPTPDER
ncbi:MAG: type II CAAX endopeptidase family protein [Jiangellales bacterium]